MRQLHALVRLARPANGLSAALAAGTGALLAAPIASYHAAVAALVVFLLVGAGNIFNDCFDIAIDRVNKPQRPLPSGSVRLPVAWATGLSMAGLGVLLSFALGPWLGASAAGVVILILLYSFRLKNTVIVGNALVGLLSGFTLAFGGLANRGLGPTVVPALLVSLFVLAREILKTIEDEAGDRQFGLRTVAVVYGRAWALRAFGVVVAAFLLLTWAYAVHIGSASLLVASLVGVQAPLVFAWVRLSRSLTQENLVLVLRLTKWGFFAGLIAVLLPRIGI